MPPPRPRALRLGSSGKPGTGYRARVLSLLLALAPAAALPAQVVNIEQQRLDSRTPGWSGSVAGNLDLTRNQRSVFTFGLNTKVQHRRDSTTWLGLVQAGLIRASGQQFQNFAFGHVRWTRGVTRVLALEAFGQLQQNRVNGIQNRSLAGAGVRVLAFDEPAGTFYVGALVLGEREREVVDSIPLHNDVRLSAYVAGSYTPESADWITVANTTYFQPRIGRFSDIRISTDWQLEVALRQNLNLVTTLNLVYDAAPPVGLESTTYALRNGLKFVFE